jgi:hypothetical protein
MPEQVPVTASDGIADLQARRQRRAPLPPRHPRAAVAAPVRAPQPSKPAPAAQQGRGGSSLAEAAEPTPRSGRSAPQRQVPKAKVTEQVELPLRLAQFYVTPQHDEALRRIRATGLVDNMDVSGSAVVRYALDQLLAKHKPEDLVKLLGSPKGQKQSQRGRPRR